MKPIILTCILFFTDALPASAAHASSALADEPHVQENNLPGHDPSGEPSDGDSVSQTIEVTVKETASGAMLFEPDTIHIDSGAVVRFVINNAGALDHEFFLGSFDEIEEHQKWMRKNPDMKHGEAKTVAIPSGQTAGLIWKFPTKTNLEFACLIPGHREAGMWGVIIVHDHLAPINKG